MTPLKAVRVFPPRSDTACAGNVLTGNETWMASALDFGWRCRCKFGPKGMLMSGQTTALKVVSVTFDR